MKRETENQIKPGEAWRQKSSENFGIFEFFPPFFSILLKKFNLFSSYSCDFFFFLQVYVSGVIWPAINEMSNI